MRESRKAREQQRAEAQHRRGHAQADGRPETRLPGPAVRAAGLHEVVNAVVHRLAHQRGTEAGGDGEHETVHLPHHHQARERAAHRRHQREQQRAPAPEHKPQQHADADGAGQGEPRHVGFDGRARLHREHAGAGQLEPQSAWRGHRQLVEHRLHARSGLGLPVRVGACRPGLQQEQRALAVARGPDAIGHGRLSLRLPAHQHLECLARGVGRELCLERQPGRRGHDVDRVEDGLAQAVVREALFVHHRAERVAVALQHGEFAVEGVEFTVLHRHEVRVGREALAQSA